MKKKLLSLALGAAAIGISGSALSAPKIFAQAQSLIWNVKFLDSANNQLTLGPGGDIAWATGSVESDVSADLRGTKDSTSHITPDPFGGNDLCGFVGLGGGTGCNAIGSGGVRGDNSYVTQTTPPAPVPEDFAKSDLMVDGSGFSLVPPSPSGSYPYRDQGLPSPQPLGFSAVDSTVSLAHDGTGSAVTNNTVNATIQVGTKDLNDVGISFDYETLLQIYKVPDKLGSVFATNKFTLSIVCASASCAGTAYSVSFTDPTLNFGISYAGKPGIDFQLSNSGSVIYHGADGGGPPINLIAGATYLVTLSHVATADATIPEPASLALMGIGLVGLAGLRRREKLA